MEWTAMPMWSSFMNLVGLYSRGSALEKRPGKGLDSIPNAPGRIAFSRGVLATTENSVAAEARPLEPESDAALGGSSCRQAAISQTR